jgi:hypothetical protein
LRFTPYHKEDEIFCYNLIKSRSSFGSFWNFGTAKARVKKTHRPGRWK